MFQVGANNPNVGDDRRKQLLQALAQQLAQRFASAQPGAGNLGGQFINPSKRRTVQHPAPFGAIRQAGAGRLTSGTPILPSFGPGGAVGDHGGGGYQHPVDLPAPTPGRLAGHSSPLPGVPVPGGTMAHVPVPMGTPSVPMSGAGSTVPVSGPGAPQGAGAAVSAVQASQPFAGASSTPSTALGGLVPLGNGIYMDPSSGQVYGGNGAQLPMGFQLAHLAAGRAPS